MSNLELDRGPSIRKRGREVPVSSWCRLRTTRLGFATCRAVSSFQLRPDQCVTELRSGCNFWWIGYTGTWALKLVLQPHRGLTAFDSIRPAMRSLIARNVLILSLRLRNFSTAMRD